MIFSQCELEEIGFVLFLLDLHIDLSRIEFGKMFYVFDSRDLFSFIIRTHDYEQIAPYMHIQYMDMMLHSLGYCRV